MKNQACKTWQSAEYEYKDLTINNGISSSHTEIKAARIKNVQFCVLKGRLYKCA